jgi:hypothetical protein
MAFFITREGGNQKMGMSPFTGPIWTSKGVGLMEEKQASLEGAFVSVPEEQPVLILPTTVSEP